jgi:Ca2+-binding RTX toxin-like protein
MRKVSLALAFSLFTVTAAHALDAKVDATGQLTVTTASTADNNIVLSCVAGAVKVNYADPSTGAYLCSNIRTISVFGTQTNDTIDLGQLSALDFTALKSTYIDAGAGDDQITGSFVKDTIHGSYGEDTIYGLNGNDSLSGDSGNDTIYGGAGADVLRGGSGNDSLYGEAGKDKLYGDSGNDYLSGGLDKDKLDGGTGKNRKKQ